MSSAVRFAVCEAEDGEGRSCAVAGAKDSAPSIKARTAADRPMRDLIIIRLSQTICCLIPTSDAAPRSCSMQCHTDRVVAVSRQKHEAHKIAQGITQREDLGRPAIFGLAYGLALSPPFAP